jgi:hypothetical protein
MEGRHLKIYVDPRGRVGFGAYTVEAVQALPQLFPEGFWHDDEDGSPRYIVPELKAVMTMEEYPQSVAASIAISAVRDQDID